METAEFLLDTLDGAELFDVRFSHEEREATRAKLIVDTPLGRPAIPARVEISPRKLSLPTEPSTPIALPVHVGYEFTPPSIPAPALEESLAEKLAAWRRRRKLRDLYDLALFAEWPSGAIWSAIAPTRRHHLAREATRTVFFKLLIP